MKCATKWAKLELLISSVSAEDDNTVRVAHKTEFRVATVVLYKKSVLTVRRYRFVLLLLEDSDSLLETHPRFRLL